MTSSLPVMQTVITAIQDLLFAVVAGSILCDAAIAAVFASSRDAARLRLRGSIKQTTPGMSLPRIRMLSLCVLAISQPFYLWLQASAMSGSTLAGTLPGLGTALAHSHYGVAWLIGAVGITLALIASRGSHHTSTSAAKRRQLFRLSVPGLALYAASKAAVSHAADAGDFSVTQVVHWIHLVATLGWAGSVMVAAFILPTLALGTRADGGRHLAFCERLSRTSAIALILVLFSGLYNFAWMSANLSAPLAGTRYGAWLGAKLALVCVAALLDTLSRTIWLPRLRAIQRTPCGDNALSQRYLATANHLYRAVFVESALLAAALVAAAALAHIPPV